MLAKIEFIVRVVNRGIEFCENVGKGISQKFFKAKYSDCCNARVREVKKGIAMEVCEECGKVHFKKTVLTKR